VAAGLVLLPQVPLMTLLVSTQTLNAVLLVPLLGAMQLLSRDRDVLGAHVVTRWTAAAQLLVLTGVIASVVVLLA
jgi:Mn2+/Fe2+ NRAMP family transporter